MKLYFIIKITIFCYIILSAKNFIFVAFLRIDYSDDSAT